MTKTEWSDWIEHDGKGTPAHCIGRICQITDFCSMQGVTTSEPLMIYGTAQNGGSWNWTNHYVPNSTGLLCTKIIRYRIAKPKGLQICEAILRKAEHMAEVRA